jgi:hypothetical protein
MFLTGGKSCARPRPTDPCVVRPLTTLTSLTDMDKRYQVFVSSTFVDLQEERQEVMQALLELDCIPAGMELFPAANEDQWSLIKRVIDDCDYYLVILGGRYGSIGPGGRSYTEMEYRYALEKGKPVLGFVHRDPGGIAANRSEATQEGKARLGAFRELVQQRLCRMWDSPADLGSQVSRSLVKLIKSTPAIGWVRADQVPDEAASEEILRLRKNIELLAAQLATVASEAPPGAENLAQGDDTYVVDFEFVARDAERSWGGTSYRSQASLSWNDIFRVLSPLMVQEATEARLKDALDEYLAESQGGELRKRTALQRKSLDDFSASLDGFHTIKIQLRALGLITKSTKPRSVKDTAAYWTLTPFGDTIMTRLRAIPRTQTDGV